MKPIALLVLSIVAVSANAFAQASAPASSDAITKALQAAPDKVKDDAGVVVWKSDFTYETLKKSNNGIVCYDISGKTVRQPFFIECTSIANLPRVAQNLKFEASGDKVKAQALLDAAEKNGTRVKPEYGSVWYHFMGPDPAHVRIHMTIALPGATTQSTGLPDNPKQGGVWIMDAGTSTAHLMTPGE
jgi:hypothetical protein